MTRLRKASRLWQRPESRELAASAMVPDDGPIFTVEAEKIFGRIAPLEVEIGAGKGEFIIARAAENPDRDFLAVELSGVVARLLAIRCARRGLANLRVVRMDARTLVNLMLRDASVAAYHVYFPDPWPKQRHAKHRLFTPTIVRNLKRTLAPSGAIHIATDVGVYASEIFAMVEAGGFRRVSDDAPGGGCSGFGRKYLAAGKVVFAASFMLSLDARASI